MEFYQDFSMIIAAVFSVTKKQKCPLASIKTPWLATSIEKVGSAYAK